ncbi:hypothetical protein ACFWIA_30385 [Streptomyces sp. NPDC127068]|uniref:hypothetical protein n=1 Tax=Streptomyces sp. NPDC127068 TaxID=3347127 RepID=UPI00366081F1
MIDNALPVIRPAPPWAPSRRVPSRRVVALAPAALACALGLWGIRREGTLWGDEAVTHAMALRSVPEIWQTLTTVDAVHGLYYLLMHGVFEVFGPGLLALRLPSLLGICATATAVALLGRRLAGPRAGLLAGLVLPLLPDAQRYAQEGRSYALVCALVAIGTLLLDERRWRAYAVVMLAACLMHEFAVLALVAHGVTVRGTRSRGWALAALAVGAVLSPLVVHSTTQSAQVDWIAAPDTGDLVFFATLVLVGWLCARTPGGARVRAVALPLLTLPMGLLLAVSFVHPLFVDRYVLPYLVGLALLLGAALDHHWSGVTALAATGAAVASLIVLGPALRSPESRKSDVTAVSELVRSTARPGDGILFTPMQRRAWTLAHPEAVAGLTDLSLRSSPRASHTLYGVEDSPTEIRDRLLHHEGRVVVVQDREGGAPDATAGEAMKRAVLADFFTLCTERTANQARVGVYVRNGDCTEVR